MKVFKRIVFIAILSFSTSSISQIKLASFFSDHMVLQQQEKVAIWGYDMPNTIVSVLGSWGGQSSTEVDQDGKWRLQIQTPVAGGPYELKIKGSTEVLLQDVLIGEVWFCSGQSNMSMPVRGFSNQPVYDSNEAILNARNPFIRSFDVERKASLKPLEDVTGTWKRTESATVRKFSAIAYFFGKKLQENLNVPIGIIHSSWGGSTMEAWTNEKTILDFESLSISYKNPDDTDEKRKSPTLLYNAMVHPFLGYRIKGMIWYQGESNRKRPEQYKKLFPAMIDSWRSEWNQGMFPFYFVQIAPFRYKDVNAAFIREAQLQIMQKVSNVGMVVTLDVGDCTSIHPGEKKIIANRLAYWALSKAYKTKGIGYSGPVYREVLKNVEGKMTLEFDYTKYGLSSFGKELTGFEIAGDDKRFYKAEAKINDDKTLNVWSAKVKKPVAVRYAFDNCVEGTLFNTQGLPASSFRTDNWKE